MLGSYSSGNGNPYFTIAASEGDGRSPRHLATAKLLNFLITAPKCSARLLHSEGIHVFRFATAGGCRSVMRSVGAKMCRRTSVLLSKRLLSAKAATHCLLGERLLTARSGS